MTYQSHITSAASSPHVKSPGSGGNASAGPRSKRKLQTLEEDDEVAAAEANALLSGEAWPKRRKKTEEKRLRQFRKEPPMSYLERLTRVQSQRMFLIDRERRISHDGTHEEEVFQLAGTTGNLYSVTISKVPSCNCPDGQKGNQCKHIIYTLINVLKARGDLQYQLAFLSTELKSIFESAPANPQSSTSIATPPGFCNRKSVEGDCPVCVMEFESHEDIIWCRAACGNNIHRQCFDKWASSKPGQVKCVYCRQNWIDDPASVKKVNIAGKKNNEGYINVASQLGLSGQRDMSSYYQPWVARQRFGWR